MTPSDRESKRTEAGKARKAGRAAGREGADRSARPAQAREAARLQRPQRPAPARMPGYRGRRRFPESNSRYRQARLLLSGSMPRIRQAVKDWFYRLRSRISELKQRLRPSGETRRNKIQTAVFLAASIAIAVFAVFEVLYTTATTVIFDGVELGTVATEEEARLACHSVEQSISDVLGYDYTITDSRVSYATGLTFRSAVVDEAQLEEALSDSLRVVEHGYALYVGGEFIGATQTEGAFEELLDQVAADYRNENTVSIDFLEGVEIVECDLPVESFTNLADAALLLNSTKAGEVTYEVEKGDVWSVIAQDNDMSNADLLALNPGYDIDKLQIGDVLLISNAVPYLTVVSVQMEYYVAEIPYEIEYVDDDTMYIGDTRVISKGEYGAADTVARVTFEGTTEVERVIESETILSEPVTEIQARGTKERPTWMPTGSFRWPTSGTITSRYGYRNIFGGTSFHSGIDIANSKGTDIVAADGGEVIYAGWQSGYGYLIQIDHLNGYVTYYGHNSKLLVSVGDKVYKGQHIAEMGATGRVTGTHCHFEVRYNGERKNPLDYLP